MTTKKQGWDWWSEVKLKILTDYLRSFTTAVSGRSKGVLFLDLFAGSYDNRRRHAAGTFAGSTRIALETAPPFTQLAFFELADQAARLETAIQAARPTDTRWRAFRGDCNELLPEALRWLEPVRWAPTFAFLDPRGLQAAWSTVERLAQWRSDKKTKVELWMLFPEPALARVLGLQGARGRRSAERLDRVYGCRDWIAIHQLRRADAITPDEMRAEFVNLLRWRLEKVLEYKTTHALQIVTTGGQPVYTMVFATDSSAGDKIMAHVYGNAATKTLPMMQARAQAAKQRRKDEQIGRLRLFEEETDQELAGNRSRYDHVPPWEPPAVLDGQLDLGDEPDIDPDEIDPDTWLEEEGDGR